MFHPVNTKKDIYKIRLKYVTSLKFSKERKIIKLHNKERSLCEELYLVKSEIELLSDQLEDLKNKISEISCQLSTTEMFKTREISKLESLRADLKAHESEFEQMFRKERELRELRDKERNEKKEEELEIERQRQAQIAEKNEQQAREFVSIEMECEALEKECSVLKKRNHAIMLKLRRKLVETEDIRRELMKKTEGKNNLT